MQRKELNLQSPLRILEASMHGGLGTGNLGVVMARAGVGKTACLVQIGLDHLMRDQDVLHVALDTKSVDEVRAWYDALFDDLAEAIDVEERDACRRSIDKHRFIQAFPRRAAIAERVEQAVSLYTDHAGFSPKVILVDGFNWEGPVAHTAAVLGAFRAMAARRGAELWLTAQTHREETGPHPMSLTAPCTEYEDIIEVALHLEPRADHVELRLLKDHDSTEPVETGLQLEPDTMRLVRFNADGSPSRPARMPVRTCTLLSGGAKGAEQAFGECAEKWGLNEVNYTFEGRPDMARKRGIYVLTRTQLQQGNVSNAYIKARMHRDYPATPTFRKVLQSIWHQVNTARQIFVVGVILEDSTVKGGTGWAAELTRHLGKELYVFDQEKQSWFLWDGESWAAHDAPTISASRFSGTGSRYLSDAGVAAINALFERSFGPA